MASKVTQRAVYLATAAIVVAMVGGFALATMALGGTNPSYQGSQTTNVTSLPGLTWLATKLSAVNTTTAYTTPCTTAATACIITTTAGATLCVGSFTGAYGTASCGSGDFVEEVTLTTVANALFYGGTGPVTITLTTYVTGTPVGGTAGTYAGPAFFLTENAAPTAAQHIVLDFDIGISSAGPGAVSTISVVATT
ncbi:MAG TPA: hypothetical protein VEH28_05950 [Thermoplasmata archaeon]|nr:hypothetical protein [Thermoplasmata archaeon]